MKDQPQDAYTVNPAADTFTIAFADRHEQDDKGAISLYPLSAEEALRAMLQTSPHKPDA